MNKNKIIVGGLVALIVLGVVAILLTLMGGSGGEGKLNMQTPQGIVEVNDYMQNPVGTTEDSYIMVESDNYRIINYKVDNSFLINLLVQPIKDSRTQAETAFLNELGIDQQSACKLAVAVKVPFAVDENFAGQELGMSFCPNAVPLP